MQWSCSVTVQFPQNIAKRSFSKVSSSYADDGEGKSGKTCFRNGPMPHTNKKIQCFCRNNIADSIVFIKPPLRLVYYPNRLFFFRSFLLSETERPSSTARSCVLSTFREYHCKIPVMGRVNYSPLKSLDSEREKNWEKNRSSLVNT